MRAWVLLAVLAGCAGEGDDGKAVQCQYDKLVWEVGDSFPANDGCNTCTCMRDGSVACTLMACVECEYDGQPYFVGDTFPAVDGCNTCSCEEDGSVSCTEIACE